MILYTKNLEKEIAFVCFSPELDKVGLESFFYVYLW